MKINNISQLYFNNDTAIYFNTWNKRIFKYNKSYEQLSLNRLYTVSITCITVELCIET